MGSGSPAVHKGRPVTGQRRSREAPPGAGPAVLGLPARLREVGNSFFCFPVPRYEQPWQPDGSVPGPARLRRTGLGSLSCGIGQWHHGGREGCRSGRPVRRGRRGRGAGGVSQGAVPPRARPARARGDCQTKMRRALAREWEGGGAGTQCTCHRPDVLRSGFDEKQESKVLRVRLYGQKKKKVSDENVGRETEGPAAGGLGALRGRGEGRLPPVADLVASGGPRAARGPAPRPSGWAQKVRLPARGRRAQEGHRPASWAGATAGGTWPPPSPGSARLRGRMLP